MESSRRLVNSTMRALNLTLILQQHHRSLILSSDPNPAIRFSRAAASSTLFHFPHPANRDRPSVRTPPSASLPKSLISSSLSQISSPPHVGRSDFSVCNAKERFLSRNLFTDAGKMGFCAEDLTVVLLGWLGSEQWLLRKYAGLYRSKGIRTVEFSALPGKDFVWDLIRFELGSKAEERIAALTEELIEWLSETEENDGRERSLLFHAFSNTGFFSYGVILDNLRRRGDFVKKIKGCIVDSAPEMSLNPQIYARGFSVALLKKKHSSIAYASAKAIAGSALSGKERSSKGQKDKLTLIEMMVESVLEKFFSYSMKSPDVKRRLNQIISTLFNNQPPCPQLYLYSTADKIISVLSVERFIQGQKKLGREVWAHNFGSSPHVDHFRNFPDIYSTQIARFLDGCIPRFCWSRIDCSFPMQHSSDCTDQVQRYPINFQSTADGSP